MHAAAFVFKMKVLSLLTKPHDIPNPTQQEHFEISVIGGGIIKVDFETETVTKREVFFIFYYYFIIILYWKFSFLV